MTSLKDDQVDRRKMEAWQHVESKRTNRGNDFLRHNKHIADRLLCHLGKRRGLLTAQHFVACLRAALAVFSDTASLGSRQRLVLHSCMFVMGRVFGSFD